MRLQDSEPELDEGNDSNTRVAVDITSRRSNQSVRLRQDVARRALVSVLRFFGLHSDPVHHIDHCRLASLSCK